MTITFIFAFMSYNSIKLTKFKVQKHTSWRSLIHCCGTSRMKQSANPAARIGHYTRTVLTSTQNASIWSLTAAAPSDSVFVCCVQIHLLTYLLTYVNTNCICISENHDKCNYPVIDVFRHITAWNCSAQITWKSPWKHSPSIYQVSLWPAILIILWLTLVIVTIYL